MYLPEWAMNSNDIYLKFLHIVLTILMAQYSKLHYTSLGVTFPVSENQIIWNHHALN